MMNYKRILSMVMSVLMLGNSVFSALPANALDILDDGENDNQPETEPDFETIVSGSPVWDVLMEAEDSAETEEAETAPETEEATEEPEPTAPAQTIPEGMTDLSKLLGENTVTDSCGEDAQWTYDLDSHILVISGTGKVMSMTYRSDEFKNYIKEVETIQVMNGISSINTAVFSGCSALTRLILPFAGTDDTENALPIYRIFGESDMWTNYVPATLTTVEITGGTIIVENGFWYIKNLEKVVLADSITSIGANAFQGRNLMTSVNMPVSLKSIGDYAFEKCTALTEVSFPETLESIGEYAFSGCSGLTEMLVPASVETLGKYAFENCTGLTNVQLPFSSDEEGNSMNWLYNSYANIEKVTILGGWKIPDNAYSNCKNLKEIILPDTITEIGSYAFKGCANLTQITLPESLENIGGYAFQNCTGLTEFTVPKNVVKIGSSMLNGCSALTKVTLPFAGLNLQNAEDEETNNDSTIKNIFYSLPETLKTIEITGGSKIPATAFEEMSTIENIILPNTITSIGESAFKGCSAVTSFTIPKTVTSISNTAFYGCSGLTEMIIPASVTEIGEQAFYGCSGLTAITLPDGLQKLGNYALQGCSSLTELTIPDSVQEIGTGLLRSCTSLTTLTLPFIGSSVESVDSITRSYSPDFTLKTLCYSYPPALTSVTVTQANKLPYHAFYQCTTLTDLTVKNVSIIRREAFKGCTALENINLDSEGITLMGGDAFAETAWMDAQANGVVYMDDMAITYKGTVPQNADVIIKEGTRLIGVEAFAEMKNIVNVQLPSTLRIINDSAFKNCTGLKEVIIPDGVTTIDSQVFYGCSKLTNVVIPDSVTSIVEDSFDFCAWQPDTDIEEGPVYVGKIFYGYKGDMLDNTKIVIEDGTTAIAEGALKGQTGLASITIPDSVTIIGASAFSGCTFLKSVEIPDGVTEIKNNTFRNCTRLASVKLPENLVSIGESAFDGDNLTNIVIPASTKKIGSYAFADNPIETVTLSDNLISVDNSAFSKIDTESATFKLIVADGAKSVTNIMTNGMSESLSAIEIPESVTTIGDSAFESFSVLDEITLPEKLEKIEQNAFKDCSALTAVIIPDTVESIGDYAFHRSALKAVEVPASVKEIGKSAFRECGDLAKVTLHDGLESIGQSAFYQDSALTSLSIPDTVTFVGNYVCCDCTALESVKLSENQTSIGAEAFGRTAISELTIPASVTTIGSNIVNDCENLTHITVSDALSSDSNYAIIGKYTVGDKQLKITIAEGSKTVTADMMELFPKECIGEIELPSTLKTIGDNAFEGCEILKNITIPESVTEIGSKAFRYCYQLQSVEIPEGVTTIHDRCFAYCNKLENIVIPESVTAIEDYAFYDCHSLAEVLLPSKLEYIKEYAFQKCTSLREINLPDSLLQYYSNSFDDCSGLTKITLAGNVAGMDFVKYGFSIGDGEPITLVITDGLKTMKNGIITGLENRLVSIELPSTVELIDESAFSDFKNLEEITIPDSVREIRSYAFYGCSSLKKVNLSNQVEIFKGYTFYNCSALEEINSEVPEFTFTTTDFRGCNSLYDTRFFMLDRRNVNFFANNNIVGSDGIINFTLNYKLSDSVAKKATNIELDLNLPSGMEIVTGSVTGLNDTSEVSTDYGNVTSISLNQPSGTIRFSARATEIATFDVEAELSFNFNKASWTESIGSLQIESPAIYLNTPAYTGSTTVKVSGVAEKGQEVSLYANDSLVETVTANKYTGKYTASLVLPAIEDGESYQIYAECGENKTDTFPVVYSATKPIVTKVFMSLNNHTDSEYDITNIFTESAKPVISINPAYPVGFEIQMDNADHAERVIVTSTKGTDVKTLEAHWNPLKKCWEAYGYFDPNNHKYVAGELNIAIKEKTPTVIDMTTGDMISADKDTLTEIYGSAVDGVTNISELENNVVNQDFVDNSTNEVLYQTENILVANTHISDGSNPENDLDTINYVGVHDEVFIDGQLLTAEEIIEKHSDMLIQSPVKVQDDDGNIHTTYIVVTGGDSGNGGEGGGNADSVREVLRLITEIQKDPANPTVPEDLITLLPSEVVHQIETVENPKTGDISVNNKISSIISTAKSSSIVAKTAVDTVSKWVNNIGTGTNKEAVERALTSLSSQELGKLKTNLQSASNFFKNATTVLAVGGSAFKYGTNLYQLGLANDSTAWGLRAGATALCGAQIFMACGGNELLAQAGLAVGTALFPPLGGPICAVAFPVLGNLILIGAEKGLDSLIKQYLENGFIKFSIDPSGIVYEAVIGNRVKGATMTVYYLDPDTGEEIEWNAEDYDQQNNLLTDADGAYAWDVPEGQWRVKFQMEGYETVYSEWMDVPPIQTGINFSVVSMNAPELVSIMAIDGSVIAVFSKYMKIDTVNADTVTIYGDEKPVTCVVEPLLHNEGDAYTDTFVITPSIGNLYDLGALTASITEGCEGYNSIAVEPITMDVTIPDNLVSLDTDSNVVIAGIGEYTQIDFTARPASIASGKKLIVNDPSGNVVTQSTTLDENGKAVLLVKPSGKGVSEITVSVEGEDVSTEITILGVTSAEVKANDALETAPPETVLTTTTTTITTTATTTTTATNATTTTSPITTTAIATTETTATTTETETTPIEVEIVLGDVKEDGEINAEDAAMILVEAALIGAGETSFTDRQNAAADINGNDVPDSEDAAYILMYAAVIGSGDTDKSLKDYFNIG